MDYNEVESLVELAKVGDKKAKEELMVKFTPLILNLSKKSYINSYEFSDIKNECYRTLFKCVCLYNCDKHRFVAYATNAIKNSVNLLIRTSIRRNSSDGPMAFIMDGKLENTLYSVLDDPNNFLINALYKNNLKAAIETLTKREREFLDFIYFKRNALKDYSKLKSIPYIQAINMNREILHKLKTFLNNPYKYSNRN